MTIQAEIRYGDSMQGPEGAEEPVPDRQQFALTYDRAPAFADVAWRAYHREVARKSSLDITLHGADDGPGEAGVA